MGFVIRDPVVLLAAAILFAAALAWWPWRRDLSRRTAWLGVIARFVAIIATILLLLDPGIRLGVGRIRPLVLLDNSVSMHATGAAADSATALAASIGEVTRFGELAPGEPGGSTRLADALAAAVAAERSIVIVSDGEVHDVAAIPADLLAQADVRLLPRPTGVNVAITDVRMPNRVAAGDTLHFEVDVRGTGVAGDTVRVELRDDGIRIASLYAVLDSSRGAATMRGATSLPTELSGPRFIEVIRVGAADSEPLDDRRWRALLISPSPGIVVIAATPDWDARALYTTLSAVTAAPVRGFVQLQPGVWHRMDDLRPVPSAEVRRTAADADLLAVRGDTAAWRTAGRARILWPTANSGGDWYLGSGGPSPVAGAMVGVDVDSLPSLPAMSDGVTGDWIGMVARRSRRGAEIPVVAGRVGGGRTVIIGAAGFHAWAMQGGTAEQVWRTLLGQTVEWLLAAPPVDPESIRLLDIVVQRGRPVRFQGSSAGEPVAIRFSRDTVSRVDTLRFDRDGVAAAVLSPGRWQWQVGSASKGELMVEQYADELLPGPVTLTAADAQVVPRPARRSLRELWPLFAVAIAGLVVEWLIRRRLALR